LRILNLPPWLCNKRKYIMMSGLIPSMSSSVSEKELQRIMKKTTCGRSSQFFGSYRIGKT
jgi:hypothetical protein